MRGIQRITVRGYKSIRNLNDFELRPLNVLIGANGAGKSNFVGFFRLLRDIVRRGLQVTLQKTEGGADGCLYMGPKITEEIEAKVSFDGCAYEFVLVPTTDNRLIFGREWARVFEPTGGESTAVSISGHDEAQIPTYRTGLGFWREGGVWDDRTVESYVLEELESVTVYHFHDTSHSAAVRRRRAINDNELLRPMAENLAPFLYRIRATNSSAYLEIRDLVRMAAPFFDDFKLRPVATSPDEIELEWLQKDSDYPFRAIHLSDGTLRFICLATALLQPDRPATMLFDEPELGLHPYALTLLGNLLKQMTSAGQGQVIVATQSAPLLNEFEPEDVIVVERQGSESIFKRLNSADLSEWLADYALGELWLKNVLGGRPRSDRQPQPVPASE